VVKDKRPGFLPSPQAPRKSGQTASNIAAGFPQAILFCALLLNIFVKFY
jgi:hypothetical protein